MECWRRSLLTLAIGSLGALLLALLHWPSPWLVGAMLSVAAANFLRWPVGLPSPTLSVVQSVLGLAVGLRLQWLASIAYVYGVLGLLLCLACQMPLLYRLYRRQLGWPPEEALLASAPGALGVMLALAADLPNPARIALVQSMRLLLLISLVSLALWLQGHADHPLLASYQRLPWSWLLCLLPLVGITGWLLNRCAIPAPFLLAGLLYGALCALQREQALLTPAGVPEATMLVLGALSGSRFSRLDGRQLWRMLWAGTLGCVLAALISLLCALAIRPFTGMPLLQLWLAYAPGGLESMIFMAMASGLDPTWVTLHHVLRVVLLSLGPALWMRQQKRRLAAQETAV